MQKKKIRKPMRFKKDCMFCKKKIAIDYKDVELLSHFVSSKRKIVSRRFSGNCAKHQRILAREVKRARYMNLIPYIMG